MTFSPVLPTGGLAGWKFLSRTLQTQQQIHANSAQPAREVEAFRERIGQLTTADALVDDRAALRVALGAYGLEGDLDNRAFIRKILSEGTEDRGAFANRLADKRYAAFAEAFGYGNASGPSVGDPAFVDATVDRYLRRDFEIVIGQRDDTMRLALTLQRELPDIVARGGTETTQWLRVLGNPPLRQVMEDAFGLPSSFAGLDLDRQISDLQSMLRRRLGADSLTALTEPETLERLTELYVARAGASTQPSVTSPIVSLFGGAANAQSLLLTLYQAR